MDRWIQRQTNILDFTLSSLWRRKGRNAALIFVYTLVVFLLASAVFFVSSLKQEARIVLKNAPEVIIQRTVAGRHDFIPLYYREKISAIRGVSSVKARLWGYYYDATAGANYTIMVPEEPPGTGIAIGEGVSRTRLAFPGDTLEFRDFKGSYLNLEISKILPSESELVSSDLVLVSPEDFRRLFGTAAEIATDFTLRVRNPKEISTVALKIAELLPDTRVILRDEILRTYETVFDWRGGLLIILIAGAFLAFAIFAWDKASGLSSEERREIGILKAIGWETSDVILLKFWEGTVISLSSFLIGLILAYVHVFFGSSALFEPALKGWAVLYPKFTLVPFIDLSQIATLFFLSVVPYTVVTIIPSWRAATIDPDSVMRT